MAATRLFHDRLFVASSRRLVGACLAIVLFSVLTETDPAVALAGAGIVFQTHPDPILRYRTKRDDIEPETTNDAFERDLELKPEAFIDTILDEENRQSILRGTPSEQRVRFAGKRYQVQNVPVEDADVDGYLLVRPESDATEHSRAAERLELLIHTLAHDLRNPLDVAMARREVATDSPEPEHFEKMADAHERMRTLIDTTLSHARVGRDTIDPEPVRLDEMASNAWDSVQTPNMTLEVVTDVTIEADSGALRTLLENLFRNAGEHARPDEDTPVTVTMDASSDSFTVADDGEGIDLEAGRELFEPGVSGAGDGTGLGLAIVETIADAHEWSCTITESQRGGTCFRFGQVTVTD